MNTPSQTKLNKRSYYFEVLLLMLIFSFGVLAFFSKQQPYFGFDLAITKQIQLLHPQYFGPVLEIITEFGYITLGSILVMVCMTGLVLFKKIPDAVVLFISTIGALSLAGLFKILINRPRPDPQIIHQLPPFQDTPSFPSGHVLFFIGLLGYLLYLSHLYLPLGLSRLLIQITLGLLILLMGISRIYVGAHWFSDILGAYLLGLVWLFFIIKIRPALIDIFFKKSP